MYIYINFKAINNVLDTKIVLKIQSFIENNSLFLQKLHRYITCHI